MQGHGPPGPKIQRGPRGNNQRKTQACGWWGEGMDFRGSGILASSPLPVTPGASQYLLQVHRDPHLLRCKLSRETCHVKE